MKPRNTQKGVHLTLPPPAPTVDEIDRKKRSA